MIRVTVTREELLKYEACEEGITAFDSLYPNGLDLEWTLETQVAIVKSELRKYLGWAADHRLIPTANLNGANLNGADLSRAGLSRADLSGANLSGANLNGANLNGANLNGANLNGANLNGANLNGANLNGANLSGVNLSWANLNGANLNGADLSGANLNGANLRRGGPQRGGPQRGDNRWRHQILRFHVSSGHLGRHAYKFQGQWFDWSDRDTRVRQVKKGTLLYGQRRSR